MGKIYHSLRELVGNTPILEFDRYEEELKLEAHIFGKLEYFNPSGSVKDRIALSMIQKAEEEGKIKKGDTILDFTSGNTGIATATYANAGGYHYTTVIQPGVSEERSLILNALGVELLHAQDVPGFMEMLAEGLTMKKLDEIMEAYAKTRGYFYISQASNPANMQAHYEHTAPEIWEAMDGKIDYLVACVGTGGTLAGASKFFREKNPDIKIIGAQPAEASRRTPEHPNPNVIDGILVFDGEKKSMPSYFDENNLPYDEVIDVVAEDAYAVGRRIARTDGAFLGQSAGAALYAATEVAKRPEAKGKNIVAVLADNAFKYLSTQMYRIKD
jgi:cysteine synthase A